MGSGFHRQWDPSSEVGSDRSTKKEKESEIEKMPLFLMYFNWSGTSEELREYTDQFKSVFDGTEDVEFKDVYNTVSGGWNAVYLLEGTWDSMMKAWGTYLRKFGRPEKVSLSKMEILVKRALEF